MKEIKFPDYNHCILNTITSILKHYNVNTNHNSLEVLDNKLSKKYKNVVLLILDGMGEHILKNISPNGFFSKNEVDCITSVFPSTTTAALTTYYSGKPPYESGWIAWSQYFKEYGRAVDMLSHKESYKGESLKDAHVDVFKTIVNYEPIFYQIEKSSPDVKAYEIMPSYSDKRAKRSIKADTVEELTENIEMLCSTNDRKFIMAYCDNPDGIMHKYGTDSIEAREFLLDTENKTERMCNKLDDTIVIISADHGHLNIENPHSILDYPEILECLYMPASFESRALTFWVKEKMKDIFVERFNNIFKDEFLLMSKNEFVEQKHLLGYGNKHPKVDDFVGNFVAISISNSMINLETLLADGKKLKKSTHCGLTKEEMEVPLIIYE